MTFYITITRNEPSPYHAGWFQSWGVDSAGQVWCNGQSPTPEPIGRVIQR